MEIARGFAELVGNTPLVRLRRLSDALGREILGKCEFMNPGGSVKDRAALAMVEDAEAKGLLKPGGVIVEGTAGNTGIGLALVGNARGYRCVIVIPETQSREKKDAIRMAGAELREVPAVPYRDENNYVKVSGRLAKELAAKEPGGALWANQFDNTANAEGHHRTTGEEIWNQTDGGVAGFVCAVGTGGTIAGVSRKLKERNPEVVVACADPEGSAIYDWVEHGELKSSGSSITEGIGQGRVTANLEGARIDRAYKIPDSEALPVLFDLVTQEGLLLGGSAGVNVAGAVRLARDLPRGSKVVTILCDGGQRYQSKLYNPEFLHEKGLPAPPWLS